MHHRRTVTVVGGPFPQMVDPVLSLTPTGGGLLADEIASLFERHFIVHRVGNFPHGDLCNSNGKTCSFDMLRETLPKAASDVVIFLPHLPNVLVDTSVSKIRLEDGEAGSLKLRPAPKLVKQVKTLHPQTLLVPFKLLEKGATKVDVLRWMMDVHAGLAVYSYLGEKDNYVIIDPLGNTSSPLPRSFLPQALLASISNLLEAKRRRSRKTKFDMPFDSPQEIPFLQPMVDFSKKMQPAFSQAVEKNVMSGRWPGNFSFRCTHGFLSARTGTSLFAITKRNVDKMGMTPQDFVYVSLELNASGELLFSGEGDGKPSIDAPVHRIVYKELPWVKGIVHGHAQAWGSQVFPTKLKCWPCGAENEGEEIMKVAPHEATDLFVVNISGHGFIALLGEGKGIEENLNTLASLRFE